MGSSPHAGYRGTSRQGSEWFSIGTLVHGTLARLEALSDAIKLTDAGAFVHFSNYEPRKMFQFIIICGEYWPLYSNIFFSFRVSFLLTFSHDFLFHYLPCLANSAILFYPYVILAFIIEKFPSRSDNVFQISHFLATTYVT